MANRVQNAKKNIISGVVSKGIALFLPFITRTCIIYSLGTMYLGLNSFFTSILQILSLAELGFGEAMVFSMYAPLSQKDTLKVRAILNLYKKIYRIIGMIVLVLGLCFLPFLEFFIKDGYPNDINIRVLYIVYLLNTVLSYWLFAYKNSLLAATQKISVNNNINSIIQVGLSLVQITLILLFRNYYLYVIVIPVFTVIRNLVTQKVSKSMYPEYYCKGSLGKKEIREIEKRVSGLFIYKICGTFRVSLDSIVISTFLGLVVLAKYENYFFIANSIVGLLTIISSGITAGVGNSIVCETTEKNYTDYFKFFFLYEWITGWCTVCLFCLYQPFMKIWVGEDLMMGNEIVTLMCMYFYILKTCDMCYVYRQAAGIWWKDKLRPVVEAIANLVLNILLVKFFGVVGVLIATVITMTSINYIWGGRVLFKTYFKKSMKEYIVKSVFYGMTTILAIAVTQFFCNMLLGDGIALFIVRMAICCVIPNVIYVVIYYRLPEFKDSITLVKNMMHRE